MNKKISHIILLSLAGMVMLTLFITRSEFYMEKFKKITFSQPHLDEQSEHQMRTFSPVWHSITRRFLP